MLYKLGYLTWFAGRGTSIPNEHDWWLAAFSTGTWLLLCYRVLLRKQDLPALKIAGLKLPSIIQEDKASERKQES